MYAQGTWVSQSRFSPAWSRASRELRRLSRWTGARLLDAGSVTVRGLWYFGAMFLLVGALGWIAWLAWRDRMAERRARRERWRRFGAWQRELIHDSSRLDRRR